MSLNRPQISGDLHRHFCRPEWSDLPGGLEAAGLLQAALDAASAIMEVYNRDSGVVDVTLKEDASPVTEADRAAQEILQKHLAQSRFVVLSEEDPGTHSAGLDALKKGEGVICVDPLDGTREFLKKNGQFSINVGVIFGGLPVFGLVLAPCSRGFQMGRIDRSTGRGYLLSAEHSAADASAAWMVRSFAGSVDEFPRAEISRGLEAEAAEGLKDSPRFVTYLSGSHVSRECERLASAGLHTDVRRLGSSLKFCRLTARQSERGDVYLRLTPTSVWDTAAGHALLLASGGHMVALRGEVSPFSYSGESLLNPGFLAWRAGFDPATAGRIIRALLT